MTRTSRWSGLPAGGPAFQHQVGFPQRRCEVISEVEVADQVQEEPPYLGLRAFPRCRRTGARQQVGVPRPLFGFARIIRVGSSEQKMHVVPDRDAFVHADLVPDQPLDQAMHLHGLAVVVDPH
jgi:hypothetical protein